MPRRILGWVSLGALVVVLILGSLSVFVVSQTQQALVLRFGNPVGVITSPGLYAKIPLIDNVVEIDKRLIDLDSPQLEIIASDQKRLTVDAFGRYRIVNPLLFYQSLGNVQIAQQRLSVLLNSAVRRVLGDASFTDLVRDHRADLMANITTQVDADASGFGVDVVDVRIRSADLPVANSQAIYQRMQTERQLVAAQTRAQGDQAGRTIRADADRQVTVITAEANGEASAMRGDGDAQRNQILAQAFSQDPDFFEFYRALQAYQTAFQSSDTRLVLSPDSEFFKFFNNPAGTGATAAAFGDSGTAGATSSATLPGSPDASGLPPITTLPNLLPPASPAPATAPTAAPPVSRPPPAPVTPGG
jgi:membrane protease subunit HflC